MSYFKEPVFVHKKATNWQSFQNYWTRFAFVIAAYAYESKFNKIWYDMHIRYLFWNKAYVPLRSGTTCVPIIASLTLNGSFFRVHNTWYFSSHSFIALMQLAWESWPSWLLIIEKRTMSGCRGQNVCKRTVYICYVYIYICIYMLWSYRMYNKTTLYFFLVKRRPVKVIQTTMWKSVWSVLKELQFIRKYLAPYVCF